MSDTNDNGGFLRKVARFVAHPTTQWSELGTPASDPRETEYAKSELKAAIERKKRNDFVRKREFDMLRKVRREGLNEATLGAMGHLHLDSEVRMSDLAPQTNLGVKAKIDAIEQQMVGESVASRFRSGASSGRNGAPAATPPRADLPPPVNRPVPVADGMELSLAPAAERSRPVVATNPAPVQPVPAAAAPQQAARPSPAPVVPKPAAAPAPGPAAATLYDPFAVEVSEVVHDSELDEVVISFANADFSSSETTLRELVQSGGARAQHPDTWLVLFDLYRATGQQAKFESLALEYARGFGLSAPQWFSLPLMVAEGDSSQKEEAPAAQEPGEVMEAGWSAPEDIDAVAVNGLRSRVAQLSPPWVLDWSHLQRVVPQGVAPLAELLQAWSRESHEMHWQGTDRLLEVLQEATPTGARDIDPANWLLRLETLRLVNRPDQFDEVAIDYCITYEVSPPSWTPARCLVHLDNEGAASGQRPLTRVGGVSTMFVESQIMHEPSMIEVATVDLCGQLVGDISEVLQGLEGRLGNATVVNVSCLRLIRVDFIAAGDLLNWVLTRRSEGRIVVFEEAHRLLALFFGAMGITEHARVKVRNV